MHASHFVVNDQVRMQYAGLYLLYVMEKEGYTFRSQLPGVESVLRPIFNRLKEQDYILVDGNSNYTPTDKALAVLDIFLDRYQTFLQDYDIYCGVDIHQRDFAFKYYSDYQEGEDWQNFLAQDRWEDLRIAVAEFKGLDPVEIVFMSMVHEGRFGREDAGWDAEMLVGYVWDEIETICNTSLRLKNLDRELGASGRSSEAILTEIIGEGARLITEFRASHDLLAALT